MLSSNNRCFGQLGAVEEVVNTAMTLSLYKMMHKAMVKVLANGCVFIHPADMEKI